MLCEAGEKMAITSANQWPQQQQMEERRGLSTAASNGKPVEKPSPAQDLALKCPRCDSSNTKFCYYNNYSLSQPRHFCKACKRYWTRGGTLRNVPVGGGCRKNKRAKRPAAADPSPPLPPPASRPQISISTAPNDIDRLIYGIPSTSSSINIGFPHSSRLASSASTPEKVSASCTAYNLQQQQPPVPQLNSMWLGFPSEEFQTGYNNPTQIQDGVSSSSLLLPDFPFFGSLSSTLTSSSLEQQKLVLGLKEGAPSNELQAYLPFHDLQVGSKPSGNTALFREVKAEQDSKLMCNKAETEWQVPCESSFGTFTSSAASSIYWNPDPNIYGSSSIAPLI